MADNTNVLREAENLVVIEGVLVENNLKVFEKNNKKTIAGQLIIQTDEKSFHAVNMISSQYKADGSENALYKSLETVMAEYKASAVHGLEQADKVRVASGKLSVKDYYTQDGRLVNFEQVSTNFINRLTAQEAEKYNPQALFTTEAYINGFVEEIKNEQPTGRIILKTIIPVYGGKIVPFKFILEEENAQQFQSYYSLGDTVKLMGELVNTVETIKLTEEVQIGTAREITKNFNVRYFRVTGGTMPYENEDPKKYSVDIIKKAWAEREVYLNDLKTKSTDNTTAPTVSGNKAMAIGGKTPAPSKTVSVASLEISEPLPF